MTLVEDAVRTRSGFESVGTDEFLDILYRIRNELRTPITQQYLDGKMAAIRSAEPAERRQLCKNLLPYLDWYISGARA